MFEVEHVISLPFVAIAIVIYSIKYNNVIGYRKSKFDMTFHVAERLLRN